MQAHRAAWEESHGLIPPGVVIRHRCHNPRCINTDHLLLGSPQDNAQDRTRAGRGYRKPGGANPGSRYTDEQIGAVWALCQEGVPQPEVARRTGVQVKTVNSVAKGWCWNHITGLPRRVSAAGLPHHSAGRGETEALPWRNRPSGMPLLDWYFSCAARDPATGCLVWQRRISEGGYGQASHRGRTINAHRAVWMETHGQIPPGQVVRHLCHNRACIEPAHLVLGTHAENSADMVEAGRSHRPLGEKNNNARLSADDALRIRDLRLAGKQARPIAHELGLPLPAVHKVISGQTWGHVTGFAPRGDNRGVRNGQAVLTETLVLDIVARCRAGTKRREVAAATGVEYATVNAIMSGRNWSWLTGIQQAPPKPRGPYRWTRRPGRQPASGPS